MELCMVVPFWTWNPKIKSFFTFSHNLTTCCDVIIPYLGIITFKIQYNSLVKQDIDICGVNQTLMHFCTLLGHFDTTSMQQYQNTMKLGPKNPLFYPQNGPKWTKMEYFVNNGLECPRK